MRKLSQTEWIAVVVGLIVVIGIFYFSAPLTFFTGGKVSVEQVADTQLVSGTIENGLMIEDKITGTGEKAQKGDELLVHYTGRLQNGQVFDSSVGREPFRFTLGAGYVIKGWDEGLVGMRVGGKRTLTIPPEMGYGPTGSGPIPPNATLVFDVELVDILNK